MFLYNGEFLIILTRGLINDREIILKKFWNSQIFNVNLMFEDESGKVLIETFFPFSPGKCGECSPTLINEFSVNNFTRNDTEMFPEKMKDLQKCSLRVATSNNSVPFIFADPLPNNSYFLHGRDISLLNTLAYALNFKIDYVFVGAEGFLLENGTASGPFQMLLEGKADLIIADYWLKVNRLIFVDYSVPYTTQQIAFVIPAGAELSSFEKFIKPLDMYTWALTMVIVGFSFLVIFVVGKRSSKLQDFIFGTGIRKPYMNVVIAAFGGSQNPVPRTNFARSLLMMFLMFWLIMRTLYTGSLYRFLQTKVYHKEAQNIDDMIERDFKFYAISTIFDLLEGNKRIYER